MKVDKVLFYLVVTLMGIGVIFSYSLSVYLNVKHGYPEYHYLVRQLVAVVVGIFLMWYLSTLDPDKYFKPIGMFLFLFFMVLLVVMHFFPDDMVKEINGAKRWIKLKFLGISISPVEFFKIGFIYFLAWSYSRKIELSQNITLKDDIKRFFPYMGLFLVVIYLVAFMQNDFGQVFVMGLILIIMGTMAGISSRLSLTIATSGIVLFLIAIMVEKTHYHRLMKWFYDFQALFLKILPDALQFEVNNIPVKLSQVSSSYDAIKNGGLFGVGIGNGLIKLGFLPEVHTDFVLSGIAEEIGVLGLIAVVLIYFFIIVRILKIANALTNKIYSQFAFGMALLLSISFFFNAFGITCVIPIKGIAVPFLSYGGSSIVANAIGIGMILMISKRAKWV